VLRLEDGTFRAFDARCTHLGCVVGVQPDAKDLVCVCHGAVFDPRTGVPRIGPATAPLRPVPVEVRDDLILLRA
jgi:Rieske Fe-S protein